MTASPFPATPARPVRWGTAPRAVLAVARAAPAASLLALWSGTAAPPRAALAAEPPAERAAPPSAPGRYQVVAVPGGEGMPPLAVMLDTATGQSWARVRLPGPPLHWAPLRFWTPGPAAGPDRAPASTAPRLSPLPPPAAAVGSRPVGAGPAGE